MSSEPSAAYLRRGRRQTVCAAPVRIEEGWKPTVIEKSADARDRCVGGAPVGDEGWVKARGLVCAGVAANGCKRVSVLPLPHLSHMVSPNQPLSAWSCLCGTLVCYLHFSPLGIAPSGLRACVHAWGSLGGANTAKT